MKDDDYNIHILDINSKRSENGTDGLLGYVVKGLYVMVHGGGNDIVNVMAADVVRVSDEV